MKKSIKNLGIVCLLVTAGFLGFIMFELENVSAQTTIYVDDDNTGFEDGSITNPYNTITEGVIAASDGDTVYVFNGTYDEQVIVNKAINLTGANPHNTTIINSSVGQDVVRIVSNWVNITGFTITGGNIGVHVWPLIENVIISNNNISSNNGGINKEGIRLGQSTSNIKIISNNISDNVDGIHLTLLSENNTITNNNIFLNTGNGTRVDSPSNNNSIYHNNFIDNAVQAHDEGNNIWNDTYPSGGNFWSDWYFPDMDCDGFVDDSRPIAGGSNQDNWPFTQMNGWLSDWANKSAYPNYAPTGMPDFEQRQRKWMTINVGGNGIPESGLGGDDILLPGPFGPNDIAIVPGPNLILESLRGGDDTEEYAYCGPTSAANCLWWFDSKFANHIGTPGDGVDDHLLVVDLGAGDDHVKGNAPLLIEDLAARFNTNMVGATDHTSMINGLNQLLIDMGLNLHYQVYNQSWPTFDFVAQDNEACNGVILFLGFYDDSGNRVWGHIVSVSGVSMGGFKIGISDPIKNVTNPMPDFTAYNYPINVSHDIYDVILGPPPPFVLPPQSWYLSGYTTGYNFSIPFPHYAVVEHAVIISPNSAPEAPTGLTATAGATYVNLTWNAPSSDGGSPITNYRIYRGTTPGGETFYMEIGNVTYFNDTTVTGGVTYYYMVSAVNGVGEGPMSNEANGTPLSVPSAPTGLLATAGDSYVNLTWDVPASDGGSPIIEYYIYRNDTAGVFDTAPASRLWYNDSTVVNGVSYTYNVSAINAIGEGPNSTVSATPMTVPSAPQNLQASAGKGYVNLTWDVPASDGGSPIIWYYIYRNDTAGVYYTVSASQLWYNDTGVTNGVSYTYNVSAINAIGEGPNSTVSVTVPTVPSDVQNLQAIAGNSYVNLTWDVPSSDGGSAILGYNIYRNDTAGLLAFVPASRLWYNDSTVVNGVSYTYNITAINSIGEGPNSTVSATPMTVPSAPQNLQASAGKGYVNLTWDVPVSDGGSPIIWYYIYRNDTAGVFDTAPASRLWYNDSTANNGVSYTYNVSAINAIGEGPNSTVSVTVPTVPSSVQNLLANAGDGYVNLTWDVPSSDGGSAILGYNIYRNDTAGVLAFVLASQLLYNDSTVTNEVSYTYNVSAVNAIGEGPNSTVTATPSAGPTVPSAVQNLLADAGVTYVNLTWDVPASDGGSPIIGYNIYRNDTAGLLAFVPASKLWHNDVTVVNGVSYTYNVSAVNAIGEGPNSTVSATVPTVPSAVQNLQADPGDSYVNLTWDVPSSDGGSAILGYNIYRNDTTGLLAFVPVSQLWHNDITVVNGVSYTYNVSAVNAIGEGPNSTVSATPMTVPSVPQNLQSDAGDGYVNLTWDAPYDDGGSPIIGYNIYRNDTGEILAFVPASQLWYNDTSVVNGVSYTYNVSAVNAIGEGPNSTVSATPMTVPSVPQNLQSDAGDGYVNLTWNAPSDDGGSSIIEYNIYRNDTAGVYDTVPASQLWYNDTAVINGMSYTYNVSAVNGVGEGPNSTVSATVPTVPSVVQNLLADSGDSYVNLTWDVPSSDGGSAILGYNIYRNDTAGVLAFVLASQLWYNDSTVVNGVSYTYNVSAVNNIGEGPNSTVTATPSAGPTAPSAVQNLQAVTDDSYVNLTWDPPASDGGSPIIEYNIYRNGTAGVYDTVPATQPWYEDTNVINGITYTYNVSAVNSVGEGPNSTISATPMAVPSEPLNLQADAGEGYINLTWEAPSDDGGSAIIGYNVYRNGTSGVYEFVPAGQLWYNDTNVSNGTTYTYNVSAVNGAGEGANSTDTSATPVTLPLAPQNLQANAGDSYVNLTWEAPTFDGGSVITWYNIYRNDTVGVYDTVTATQLWYNDTNVSNGITYTYNVSANNSIGEGPNSTGINGTPMTVPSVTQNFLANAGDGYINLTWEAPSDDGGSATTWYNIYRNDTAGVYDTIPADRLWYNDTNVTNGMSYTYRVSANNSVGESPLSAERSIKAGAVPSAPRDLSATAGDSYVYLTWNPPAFNGGLPVTNYIIYSSITPGNETFLVKIGNVSYYNDTTVTNGITYYYNVSAENAIGEGPLSVEESATPFGLPSEPMGLTATAGDSYVNLTWDEPFFNGGFPIIGYNIYRGETPDQKTLIDEIENVTFYNDTDVTNDITYYYNVSAVNAFGEGPLSTEVNATPAVPSVPVNQPPTCEISSPSPGATISGTIEISGIASDTDGTVQSVEIRVDDGGWIEVNGTTSWSYDFDTATLSNGQHTIYARAYDGENHSEEASVIVEVDNPSPAVAKPIFEEAWFWILIVLIIIIILLLAILAAKRRKKRPVEEIEEVEEKPEEEEEPVEELEEEEPVEEFEEEGFEYEEEPVEEFEEEEIVEEAEEEPFEEVRGEEEFVEEPKEGIVEGAVIEEELFECPDCGATLGPTEYVCPSCGAEFEEEEEEELGKEEAEGEMFECPECGAALGPGDTVCPNCGIEFEEVE